MNAITFPTMPARTVGDIRSLLAAGIDGAVLVDVSLLAMLLDAATPKPRKPRTAINSFETFQPIRRAACEAAIAAHGPRWSINPAVSRWANIPAAWATCKIFGGSKAGPRDMPVPLAEFWPGGVYPAGMIIAEPGAVSVNPGGTVYGHAEIAALVAESRLAWAAEAEAVAEVYADAAD